MRASDRSFPVRKELMGAKVANQPEENMRKTIGIVFAASVLASSAQAQGQVDKPWQISGYSPNSMSAINLSSIRVDGNLRRAWWVMVIRDFDGFMIGRETFDCQNETRVSTDKILYDASFRSLGPVEVTDGVRSIIPGTISQGEFDVVCHGEFEHSETFARQEDFARWARSEIEMLTPFANNTR